MNEPRFLSISIMLLGDYTTKNNVSFDPTCYNKTIYSELGQALILSSDRGNKDKF